MNALNEFALLFAVATPLIVLLGMNLFLMFEGERGTLILPSPGWESPEGSADDNLRTAAPANEPAFRNVA